MEKALLDTDIFSEVLKGKQAQVVARAQAYQAVHGVFTISVVTVMEIVRGFHQAGKVGQLDQMRKTGILSLEVSQAMRTVRGIYQDGTIRLLEPVNLQDQQEVTILIPEGDEPDHPALRYAGMLSDLTPEEAQAFDEALRWRLPLSRSLPL